MKSNAWKVLTAALVLGIAGDGLLRGGDWRLGFAIWIVAVIAAVFVLGGRTTRPALLLLGGMALAAFGFVWRDAEMLYAIDLLSLLCVGALALWYGSGGDFGALTIVETVRAGIIALVNSIGGAVSVVGELTTATDGTATRSSVRALLIGAVLALPPLALVASLLASSDVVFDGVLQRVLTIITSDGLRHLVIITLLAWITTGWLRASMGDGAGSALPHAPSPGLSFTSVAVGLYALIALLGLFVITQARVVFGGAAFLRETAGLTVASYARSGFFQLIFAAVVVLITLVVAQWLMDDDDDAGHLQFTIAGAVLLALVATLLVSAAVRIWLYVSEFGLSADRTFASAGIVWVTGLLITLALTTLRGRPMQFMPVAIAVSVAWVATVNLINPEALVVHVNTSRAAAGQPFDAEYHAKLSADAVPSLVRAAPRLAPADCQRLEVALRLVWAARIAPPPPMKRGDWRSMALPRMRAEAWHTSRVALCPASVSLSERVAPSPP